MIYRSQPGPETAGGPTARNTEEAAEDDVIDAEVVDTEGRSS